MSRLAPWFPGLAVVPELKFSAITERAPRAGSHLDRRATPPWTSPAQTSPAWPWAHMLASRQERYNPPKLIDQAQDPRAKVRPDFGVRSVTWRAWSVRRVREPERGEYGDEIL